MGATTSNELTAKTPTTAASTKGMVRLTHVSRMKFDTLIDWTSPVHSHVKGYRVVLFIFKF